MSNTPDFNRSILQKLNSVDWEKRNLEVYVKRDDLIHPIISGNKWRKLIYNVEEAKFRKNQTIITFGGAFSNHLVATAAACKQKGLQAVGIVRGEELTSNSNETLQTCATFGMKLVFVSREEYQLKTDELWLKELHLRFPNSYIVPEGGANYQGILGCQEICRELPSDINHIFVAQGTTTTSCGLLIGANPNCKVHGVPVLKNFDVREEMKRLLQRAYLDDVSIIEMLDEKLVVEDQYHFGGYGKYTPELLSYIQTKYREFNLKLDPIYTGKAFYAMEQFITNNDLENQKIVFLHTGGLQGCKGVEEKAGIRLFE